MSMQHRVEIVGARESSVGDAVSRVMSLSERVISDHLELLKLDTQDQLRNAARRIAVLAAAGTLFLLGWAALVGAILATLSDQFGLGLLLLAVSAFHVCIAVGLRLTAPTGTAPSKPRIDR